MAADDGAPRPVPTRGLVFVDEFCRHSGLGRATVEQLMHDGRIEGGYSEDGRPIGFFDDALPSREQLLEWRLSPRQDYTPDTARSHTSAAEDALVSRPRDDRPSWTMSWD